MRKPRYPDFSAVLTFAHLRAAGTTARSLPQQVISRGRPELVRLRASAKRPRRRIWVIAAILFVVSAAVGYEIRTSALESLLISRVARRATYSVQPGPSTRIVFPQPGPFDDRLGYA